MGLLIAFAVVGIVCFSLGLLVPRESKETVCNHGIPGRVIVILEQEGSLQQRDFVCDQVDDSKGIIDWSLNGELVFSLRHQDFRSANYFPEDPHA